MTDHDWMMDSNLHDDALLPMAHQIYDQQMKKGELEGRENIDELSLKARCTVSGV